MNKITAYIVCVHVQMWPAMRCGSVQSVCHHLTHKYKPMKLSIRMPGRVRGAAGREVPPSFPLFLFFDTGNSNLAAGGCKKSEVERAQSEKDLLGMGCWGVFWKRCIKEMFWFCMGNGICAEDTEAVCPSRSG